MYFCENYTNMKQFLFSIGCLSALLLPTFHASAEETEPLASNVVVPVKRSLVEEYTGLWCTFCPRGYVALEMLAEEYGKDFIAISYHADDQIECMNLKDRFPMEVPGYPGCSIDRVSTFDPEFLYNNYPMSLKETTNADVQVKIEWTDETHTTLRATSTVTFVEDIPNGNYKLAHILVADGLSHPSWRQSNYYSNSKDESLTGKWWDLFTKGPAYVSGLTFNFIPVYSDGTKGKEGIIPANITAYEPITYSSTVNTDDILNKMNQKIVEMSGSYDNLRMISILIDGKTGQVVNCNTSNYLGDDPDNPGGEVDPDDPEDPDNPGSEVDPDDPDNPDNPGGEVDPDDPDNPDNPGGDVDPDDPDNPGADVDPDDPDNPETPEEPEEGDTSAVGSVQALNIMETIFLNLNGSRIDRPDRGVYLKVDILSDGSRRVSKIVR